MTACRPPLAIAAVAAAAVLASCAGDDDPPHGSSTAGRSQPANAVRLQREYTVRGRDRRVDARLSFDNVIDPYRSIAVPPKDARYAGAQLHILNRGPDPFPIRWARFRGYDERGRPLPAGTQSTQLRRTMPDRPVRGQVLTSVVAFTVPRGRRLASIRMTSIVRLWRFRARWTLPR